MEVIDFYYDTLSPYSWLAQKKIKKLRQLNTLSFRFIPILFAGLLKHHNMVGPVEIESKRVYLWADIIRLAQMESLTLKGPPKHPFNPLLTLRAIASIKIEVDRQVFTEQIFKKIWEEGKDPEDSKIILESAAECRLDGEEILKRSASSDIKNSLKENTQKAIQKNIFGIPTFCYQNQIFWGHDRVDMMISVIHKTLVFDEELFSKLVKTKDTQRCL